ncbi:6-phosphogluconolactonase, eukaryotic type [hydrothermal vent metagenome]|uniref:6-phosphogluconolactonase, eukaryotic type n=1 Tax=hydrothermal vent metagenome TaxID=652676 RepID=A0A3B0Z4D0_9ZZZZ
MHHWTVSTSFDAASIAAANFIAAQMSAAIEARGICHMIVPGGNTPAGCFAALAKISLPWDKLHCYPGDERCYQVGHAERNDVMIEASFLSRLPGIHFHPMPAELGAEQAALAYQATIKAVDLFDIAFLGMGEDGHTASLFPGNAALAETASVVAVHDSPKPPADRISMSMPVLRQARLRVVLAAGRSKASIMERVRSGEPLPVNQVGDIHWFVDEASLSADSKPSC